MEKFAQNESDQISELINYLRKQKLLDIALKGALIGSGLGMATTASQDNPDLLKMVANMYRYGLFGSGLGIAAPIIAEIIARKYGIK